MRVSQVNNSLKEACNNVRASLMQLQIELLLAD
jgi:hypothetical protein